MEVNLTGLKNLYQCHVDTISKCTALAIRIGATKLAISKRNRKLFKLFQGMI